MKKVIILLTLFLGCVSLPNHIDADIQKASRDLKEIIDYRGMTQEVQIAQDSLKAVITEVTRQRQKFALFRTFALVPKKLEAAKIKIEQAKTAKLTTSFYQTRTENESVIAIRKIAEEAISAIERIEKNQ